MSKLQPIPLHRVTIHDNFWEPRIRRNREVSIPAIYQLCQDTGRLAMLHKGWKPAPGQEAHFFWDSDVAKWLEAASYSLASHPDPALEQRVDEVIELFVKLQEPDGYVNSYFINVAPEYRWKNLSFYHELYCAGHLIEAGVAHVQATGKHTLLNVVRRYADHIYDVFGPGKRVGLCGHQEIELALVKLFRVTGDRRYLELSQLFLDRRGTTTVFKDEGQDLPPQVAQWYRQFYGAALPHTHQSLSEPHVTPWDSQFYGEGDQFTTEYCQDHLPVRQQTRAVGHAVRAMYMYSAMADIAYETGELELLAALQRLWKNVCEQQMYVTGGIGPSRIRKGDTEDFEGFTTDYDLPNLTAYAETCAAIGMVFWNHRMFHIEPQRRYLDILERELYNGAICGGALDGTHFFYENPLQSKGHHHRQTWYAVSCCPPNLARLLASLGQYIYSQADRDVFVNLYIQSDVRLDIGEQHVVLQQTTNYPWEETVQLTIQTDQPTPFALHFRLPEWCRRADALVNDDPIDVASATNANGYMRLAREWRSGDTVTLTLAMPIEQIESHPAILDNIGCVALQRGPVVYCLEQYDHTVPLHQILLPREAQFSARFEPDLLHGVTVLNATGLAAQEREPSQLLYRQDPSLTYQPCQITAIPYYAWDNRQPGAMRVWIRSAN
jgi:uncharacterized protein